MPAPACPAGVVTRRAPAAYFKYIDEWRRSGHFEGLTFR